MSELYNIIEQLCANKKINITTMCRETDVSRGSLTDLKMGRKQTLSAKSLAKIADYFNVTVDFLISRKDSKKEGEEENEDKESTPLNNERGAAMDFVKDLSDSDFVRYCSIIKAIFPDKFKE